jgi:hypothetical protein
MRIAVVTLLSVLVLACGGATPSAAPTAAPTNAATSAPTAAPTSAPTLAPTIAPPVGGAPLCASDWTTSPGTCGGAVGDRFMFQCPPGGRTTAIYGTDTYTDDSGACAAAVHAGLIDFLSGGAVTVELTPGLDAYIGTTRNGVQSSSWGNWGTSFVFVDGTVAVPTSTPGTGGPPPADAVILAHIPPAMNVNCGKVTTLSAGEITSASCSPPTVPGYITYTLFETGDNAMDKWFSDLEYFAPGVSGSDCAAGPCLVAWFRDGFSEGRYFGNHYTGVDPNGLMGKWFDHGLMIVGTLVVHDMTFGDMYNLALEAGPIP